MRNSCILEQLQNPAISQPTCSRNENILEQLQNPANQCFPEEEKLAKEAAERVALIPVEQVVNNNSWLRNLGTTSLKVAVETAKAFSLSRLFQLILAARR